MKTHMRIDKARLVGFLMSVVLLTIAIVFVCVEGCAGRDPITGAPLGVGEKLVDSVVAVGDAALDVGSNPSILGGIAALMAAVGSITAIWKGGPPLARGCKMLAKKITSVKEKKKGKG